MGIVQELVNVLDWRLFFNNIQPFHLVNTIYSLLLNVRYSLLKVIKSILQEAQLSKLEKLNLTLENLSASMSSGFSEIS